MRFGLRMGLLLVLGVTFLPVGLAAQDNTRVVIEGTLVHAITGVPIEGANVSFSEPEVNLLSDSAGYFRISDIAIGTYRLSVSADGFRSMEGDFRVDRAGEFTLRMEPEAVPDEGILGQIRGIVRDRASGDALESAQISLPNLSRTVLSDAHGRFSIRDIPAGNFLMKTEHLGYGERSDSVLIPTGHLVSFELELTVEAIELEPLSVDVERRILGLDLSGFYDRRDTNPGTFLSRDQIEEKLPRFASDIFLGLPGVRLLGASGVDRAVVFRAGLRQTLESNPDREEFCGPTVYLDGMVYERGGMNSVSAYLDRIIEPSAIVGLELYSSSATVPLEFRGISSDCGVIVIWTR